MDGSPTPLFVADVFAKVLLATSAAVALGWVLAILAFGHLAVRDMLHEMQDERGDRFLTAGSPLRMNGHAPPLSDRAPELGEHTESVLKEWLNPT